jgi:hypothetical protein
MEPKTKLELWRISMLSINLFRDLGEYGVSPTMQGM